MRKAARKYWWAGLLAVGAVLGSLGGAVHYSESPSFCNSCHIMEPYYQAWAHSKHSHVACVECHYPPGTPRTLVWKKFQALSQVVKYVTRTYSSRPFAEVDDASCLRSGCHSTRLLSGKLITSKGIRFDHRPHLTETRRGRKLRCVSCHSQIVVGRHVEVTYETCFLCHFKGMGEGTAFKPIAGCLGCHELPRRSFKIGNMTYNHRDFVTARGVSCANCHVEAVQGKGDASPDRCLACHNQPEKLARVGDIPFIHETHVTLHHVACIHCHEEIRHGFPESGEALLPRLDEPALPVSTAPPAGHPPTLAFECGFCHQNKHAGQLVMYSGKAETLGLPDMPSPMFSAHVDCVGCHYQEKPDGAKEFRGRTFRASDQACVKCHGDKFKGIWEEAKAQLSAALGALEAKREAVGKAVAASGGPDADRAKRKAEAERGARLLEFVRASHGEHNIYLASLALRRADEALSEAAQGLSGDLPDASSQPLISGSFCATMCHVKVGVKVPPETVQAFGKTMPHRAHADMMGCAQCHDIGAHKKVPLKKGVQALCATCHPQ